MLSNFLFSGNPEGKPVGSHNHLFIFSRLFDPSLTETANPWVNQRSLAVLLNFSIRQSNDHENSLARAPSSQCEPFSRFISQHAIFCPLSSQITIKSFQCVYTYFKFLGKILVGCCARRWQTRSTSDFLSSWVGKQQEKSGRLVVDIEFMRMC